MSRIFPRLKAHFVQPTLFRRNAPNLLVPTAGFAVLFVINWILKFFEEPTSENILDIAFPAVLIGLSLIYAAEWVARGRIVLAGILRIAAYFLFGIGAILTILTLIWWLG